MRKLATVLLGVCLCAAVLVSCGKKNDVDESMSYTFNDHVTALATNWNPHTWETNADDVINRLYLTSPFCTISIKDSENGVYQWVYEMATAITDVTAENQSDLTKYGVSLPEGQTAETTTAGYVYEIALNPDAKWQNGEIINADSYVYSMQQLLNPQMKNYRANLYIAGESALAGAEAYYYSGSTAWMDNQGKYAVSDLIKTADGSYATVDGMPIKISTGKELAWLRGATLSSMVDQYGAAMFDTASFDALKKQADSDGYVTLNDETLALLKKVITFSSDWGETEAEACQYLVYGKTYPETSFDTVGLYKVDDYTIRYVTQNYIDINYFRTACTSTWLVHEDLYEAGKDTSGKLVTTNYGTKVENSMSYGPYKLESIQPDRQMVLVQNENWYGWEKQEDGSLLSFTDYLVDGEHVQRWQTTKIVIDVMDESAAKQAFLKGGLSVWSPPAEELANYSLSDQLYQEDETYTQSFFFNTNLAHLKEMDRSKGNTNSVVLTNEDFRRAFSLAIDREEYVTATPGYKPAYALMGNLYFYDIYNDPESSYRNSEPAMEAVCNLYGVEYGPGTAYATLEEAYKSVNGYNLTEAQALMKKACDQLVKDGLYTAGQDIVIRIAWAAGAITSSNNNQIALMNKYINAAAEGSGFGKITLEGVGNLENRYAAVPSGEYAIGYGAWGGAAFYPFRNLQVYCNSDMYALNEAACWDPSVEKTTLTVEGKPVTMTWKDWSDALIGNGPYSTASNQVKLEVTAQLEEQYLRKFYRIPLCTTTICTLLSFKNSYYTDNYNVMYSFGGLELMKYHYNDAEWKEFLSTQNGTLNYE